MDDNRFFFGINGLDGEVRAAPRIGGGRWLAVFTTARGVLHQWSARARQRRALLSLDERLLADIGAHPGAARLEAGKPFWRR